MDTPSLLFLIISNVQPETIHYFSIFPSTYLNLSRKDNLAITILNVVLQHPRISNLDLVKEILTLSYYPTTLAYAYLMMLCFMNFE